MFRSTTLNKREHLLLFLQYVYSRSKSIQVLSPWSHDALQKLEQKNISGEKKEPNRILLHGKKARHSSFWLKHIVHFQQEKVKSIRDLQPNPMEPHIFCVLVCTYQVHIKNSEKMRNWKI